MQGQESLHRDQAGGGDGSKSFSVPDRGSENMRWRALCNGGPNNTTVGTEKDSLGKAIGTLESMMKSLHATIGQVQRIDEQRKLADGVFVENEKEAGCDGG